MKNRRRIFVEFALATGLLAPVALAQKPPGPGPTPPPARVPPTPGTPSVPLAPDSSTSQPNQPGLDLVMFLRGRVTTSDGTALPSDVVVERVCNSTVRQQVYASFHGDFTMQLGSKTDPVVDASADPAPQYGEASNTSETGISRRELANCELRTSASGFYSSVVSLVDLDAFSGTADVGAIVVQRTTKIEGATLSATPYKAPKDARKAYEKGLEAQKNGKLTDARKYFEKAVEIYPRYANAWFALGNVLQKEDQKDAAHTAYTHATTIDAKFLPPYLSLASMAYEEENWTEVLNLTGHILDFDPLKNVTGYVVDLDPINYAEAYFYNSVANYKLNKIEDAEKSALKAEHRLTRFPQLHLILADICVRKNDYASAISELQMYLELAPHAKNTDQVREQLAKLEKLNGPVSTSEIPDQN